MIVLQLGALLVSIPTVEQAVEFVDLVGLSGQFPMPEIEAAPPAPEPPRHFRKPVDTSALVRPEKPQPPMQPCVECGNDYAEGYCPHGKSRRPSVPKPPAPRSPPVERAAVAAPPRPQPMAQPAPRREEFEVRAAVANAEVDVKILNVLRENPRTPMHELALAIFPDRPNGIRLVRLRLVQLEANGQIHRIGAGEYRQGPRADTDGRFAETKKRRGRPPTTYRPAHEFDDESVEDLEEPSEAIEDEAGIDPDE